MFSRYTHPVHNKYTTTLSHVPKPYIKLARYSFLVPDSRHGMRVAKDENGNSFIDISLTYEQHYAAPVVSRFSYTTLHFNFLR